MFKPGDIVVYRHHVCEIAQVREAYFENRDYFELHTLFERSLKLYVAVDDAVEPNMRYPMNREEADKLMALFAIADTIDEEILHAQGTTLSLAERRVKEEYERRMKTNDPADLIPILKSAYARTREREDAGKRTTAVDKKYFDLAESLLCDELSVALDVDREAMPDYLAERVGNLVD